MKPSAGSTATYSNKNGHHGSQGTRAAASGLTLDLAQTRTGSSLLELLVASLVNYYGGCTFWTRNSGLPLLAGDPLLGPSGN